MALKTTWKHYSKISVAPLVSHSLFFNFTLWNRGSKLKSFELILWSVLQRWYRYICVFVLHYVYLSKSFAIKRMFWFRNYSRAIFSLRLDYVRLFDGATLLCPQMPKENFHFIFLIHSKCLKGNSVKFVFYSSKFTGGDIAHHFMFEPNCSPMNSLAQTFCFFVSKNEWKLYIYFFLHLCFIVLVLLCFS